MNSIWYSYSFQIAKRILFGIRIRSKITIRPNTDPSHTALAMAFYALLLMRTVGGPGCA